MTAAEPRQLASGTMLDDKYRIERLLAVGGMGAVYLGTHVKLRKRVAIKLINPGLANKATIERFHREAITASQIGHEGIAQVTDLGTSSEGEHFLVMEYLEGDSLAARLKANGPLPIDIACELGCAILSPLGAAHAAGIVHRDLKPDNVFLVRQSRGEMVKLLDFGISRAAGLEQEFRLTTTGLVLGTPYYMSPEQARGDLDVGPAADLYAFGVMLYEMLVGQVPIHGDNYNQLMYRVMTGEYDPPRARRADIPLELEHIILRTMSIEPAHRPASAAELEHALLAFCRPTYREHTIERLSGSRLSSAAMPFGTTPGPRFSSTGAPPVGTAGTVLAPTPPPMPAVKPKSRAPIAIVAVVVLAAAAGGIAFALRGSDPPAPPPAQAPIAIDAAVAVAPAQPDAPEATPATVPAKVTLRFAVEPAGAKIAVDGSPVTGGELAVDKDAAAHRLTITAPGYVAHDEPIRFDESQRLSIQLKKVPAKGTPARPPKKNGKPERIDTESPYQ